MGLADDVKIISADDHLQEPPDLWSARLPRLLRDRGPRVVRLPDGSDAWAVEGAQPRPFGILVQAGKQAHEKKDSGMTWADVPKGAWDPDARIKDMDLDRIDATLLYPNVGLDFFMGQVKLAPDLALPVCRAYNDYLSEWCSTHPRRLYGIALIPCDDIDGAVAEMRRAAKLPNIKGALIPTVPPVADWNDTRYEPLWQTAEELGMILSIHAGKPRGLPHRNDLYKTPGGAMIYMQLGRLSLIETLGFLVWSGVFERHPGLKFVSVEGDIGWLPYFAERGEGVIKRHGGWAGHKLKYPPGYWFGKSLFATFEEDKVGIKMRHDIGIDALMWASDYPHSATTWPESAQSIAETFEGVPQPELRKIVHDNAARLYGLS
jgi:predicted TIM-barrel fold metal-dependent hydrolase